MSDPDPLPDSEPFQDPQPPKTDPGLPGEPDPAPAYDPPEPDTVAWMLPIGGAVGEAD